ncbi:hypothetical protein TUM3792_45240 [Shewanella sp. MBTL60-007]|nr:hypothetical protein TUM3792_45240 [Shewanella sp. MBTL60-007]
MGRNLCFALMGIVLENENLSQDFRIYEASILTIELSLLYISGYDFIAYLIFLMLFLIHIALLAINTTTVKPLTFTGLMVKLDSSITN